MSGAIDLPGAVAALVHHLPMFAAVGWLIRVPPFSRDEGHEAITREAWQDLTLTNEQRQALIRGVRAPDASLLGILTSALPFAQRRHALRAWSGTTAADGIRDMREFLAKRHFRALSLPDGWRRWAALGEALHCLQDSYSPAHVDRIGARIVYMKHWGPLGGLRRGRPGGGPRDEHGFPSDRRDSAWSNGTLTEEARAAASASRRYLEIATRQCESRESEDLQRQEFAAFLNTCVVTEIDEWDAT